MEGVRPVPGTNASPEEVLGRIVPGDPLALVPLVAERLRARALFLDARQVALRVCARVALEGEGLAPDASPCEDRSVRRRRRARLEQLVERTLDDLADGVDGSGEAGGEDGLLDAPAAFGEPLGLSSGEVRQGLADFHRLPLATRRLFRELVVERRPLRSLASEFDRPAVELLREARAAFEHLFGRPVVRIAVPTRSEGPTGSGGPIAASAASSTGRPSAAPTAPPTARPNDASRAAPGPAP